MRRSGRALVAALAFGAIVLGAVALQRPETPFQGRAAAQAQDGVTTVTSDPGVPGSGVNLNELPLQDGIIPSTPVVPGAAPTAAATGISPTTSLGGSDVAVSSEGGSYEIDAPRRKGKRLPVPTPRP